MAPMSYALTEVATADENRTTNFDDHRALFSIFYPGVRRQTQAPTEDTANFPATPRPTQWPTDEPTPAPTAKPTDIPTSKPTDAPTVKPTDAPTASPAQEEDEDNKDGETATPSSLLL